MLGDFKQQVKLRRQICRSFCIYGTIIRSQLAIFGMGMEFIFRLKIYHIKNIQLRKYILVKLWAGQHLAVAI